MNPSSFLITHPHSSIHPSCLLHPPIHFLNSSSFSHLFTLPLFIHIFTLLPFRQSLHPHIHPLHPSSSSSSFFLLLLCILLLLFLSIYRHNLLCNRLSFRFHLRLLNLLHHTHQAYASSSPFSIPLN